MSYRYHVCEEEMIRKLMRKRGTKLAGNKRVFLVTDNDSPPGFDTNIAPAQTVYGDLLTYGITINTYFIDRPDQRFDPRGFWNVSKFSQKKKHKKRRLTKVGCIKS